MNTYKTFAALLCAVVLGACDKNTPVEISTPFTSGAQIRFFNFGPSSPGVNFYAGETKLTAVLSGTGQESANGTAYSNAAAGGLYTSIAPAQYTLSGRLPGTTTAVSSLTTTLEDGKRYSYYQSGIYNSTTQTSEAFVVEDPLTPQIDFSVANVRFVNAISNANPMTLYAKNPATGDSIAVGGAVAYKAAGAFVSVPNGVYDLTTRYTGSNTAVITRTGQSFLAGRVYTVSARGDITVVSTTATNRPFLDNTANR